MPARIRWDAREDFALAAGHWGGTIGLRCGADEVHLRINRGGAVEVDRHAPLGSTFTLGASELTWTELITGEHNDFVLRLERGEFEVSGNRCEYRRWREAPAGIVDTARDVARR
ncbi:hypothetical protein HFP15_33035 [Amycolatopsis sp. K13G38]|uniref:Uncharacterized protein n=1 Tax=Amycolatopsis acididurans TaxID=2724524 RepID=A0ABX1JDG4_9PSEU|nr:hypothetical protein [Amycolatopsis acididurans]NKQ57698.1 hypothetical protein [Amycolatopsis acididurans]